MNHKLIKKFLVIVRHCKKKNALQELAQAFWTSSAKIAKLLLRTQWNTCHPKLVQARDEHSEIRV